MVPVRDPVIVPVRDPVIVPVREPAVRDPLIVPANDTVANDNVKSITIEAFRSVCMSILLVMIYCYGGGTG